MSKKTQSGIYVEILIRKSVEEIWALTQEPQHHERWDLRFDQIQYLPRPDDEEPQRFLYETRIGLDSPSKAQERALVSANSRPAKARLH